MEQNSERGVKERKKEREKEKKGRKESSSRPVLLGSSQGRQEGPGTISHTRLHIETNTPPPPLSLPLSLSRSLSLSLSLSLCLSLSVLHRSSSHCGFNQSLSFAR